MGCLVDNNLSKDLGERILNSLSYFLPCFSQLIVLPSCVRACSHAHGGCVRSGPPRHPFLFFLGGFFGEGEECGCLLRAVSCLALCTLCHGLQHDLPCKAWIIYNDIVYCSKSNPCIISLSTTVCVQCMVIWEIL